MEMSELMPLIDAPATEIRNPITCRGWGTKTGSDREGGAPAVGSVKAPLLRRTATGKTRRKRSPPAAFKAAEFDPLRTIPAAMPATGHAPFATFLNAPE